MAYAIENHVMFVNKVELTRVYLNKAKAEQQAYVSGLYESDKEMIKAVDNFVLDKGQCLSLGRAIVSFYEVEMNETKAKGLSEDKEAAKIAEIKAAKNNAMSKLRVYLSRAFEADHSSEDSPCEYKIGLKMATKNDPDRIVVNRKETAKQKTVHEAVKELVEQYGASAVLEAVQSNADIVTAAKAQS